MVRISVLNPETVVRVQYVKLMSNKQNKTKTKKKTYKNLLINNPQTNKQIKTYKKAKKSHTKKQQSNKVKVTSFGRASLSYSAVQEPFDI